MEVSFAKFDANHDRVLDFDEFRAFLAENADVLHLSTSIVQQKLAQADLLKPLAEAVSKIKTERLE